MAYLLDANVFISAHRLYYGMNLCPGFWDALTALHDAGSPYSASQASTKN